MNRLLPLTSRRAVMAGLLLTLFGATAAQAAGPKFRITDLGTGTPVDINNKGQVLISSGSNFIPQVIWQNGTTTVVTEGSNMVFALNESARVAGAVAQPDFTTLPGWWRAGRAPTLLPVEAPGVNRGTSIANDGTVAGWSVLASGALTPTVWRPDGSVITLASALPFQSYPYWQTPAVNSSGVVAVPGWDRAFRVDTVGGGVSTLVGFGTGVPWPLSDGASLSTAINERGWVVGHSHASFTYADGTPGGGRYQATLWKTDNVPIDLGVLTTVSTYPSVNSTAYGINAGGVVVGTTSTQGSWGGPSAAFGWTASTGIVDLNTLIDPADPLAGQVTLLTATGINDRNQIIGVLNGPQGPRAYLLTPVR